MQEKIFSDWPKGSAKAAAIGPVGSFLAGYFQITLRGSQGKAMIDFVMLVCASVGAMAFGILAAYGTLRVGFALMRPPSRLMPAKARPQSLTANS
jgi:hypothetical protein